MVVDRRQHGHGRACRGETQCEWCEVSLPFKQLHQHLNGRRHNSTRFYGDSKHVVRPIEQRNSIGGRVRMLKPSEVNDRLVHIVRRVREVATQRRELVAHTGISYFDRACSRFEPETICAALIEFEAKWPPERAGAACGACADVVEVTFVRSSALELLCIADRLRHATHAPLLKLSVAVQAAELENGQPPPQSDEMDGMLTSLALHALARALGELPHTSRVQLDLVLGRALRERRHMAMFVSKLRESILSDRGSLQRLVLNADQMSALRQSDIDALHEAAAHAWHARHLAFLLGTHDRVGGQSPVRLLPATVVELIVEMAEAECRTSVSMVWETPAPHAPVLPSVPGDDLGFLISVLNHDVGVI